MYIYRRAFNYSYYYTLKRIRFKIVDFIDVLRKVLY